jgi:hypothetical protein
MKDVFDIKNIMEIYDIASGISKVLNPENKYPIDCKTTIRKLGGIISYSDLQLKNMCKIKKLDNKFDDEDFNFEIIINNKHKDDKMLLPIQVGNIFIQMGFYDDEKWITGNNIFTDNINTLSHAESVQFAYGFLMPIPDFYQSIKDNANNREMKTDLGKVSEYFGVRLEDVVIYARNIGIINE